MKAISTFQLWITLQDPNEKAIAAGAYTVFMIGDKTYGVWRFLHYLQNLSCEGTFFRRTGLISGLIPRSTCTVYRQPTIPTLLCLSTDTGLPFSIVGPEKSWYLLICLAKSGMKWRANKNKVCIDTNPYVWYIYSPYREAVRIYNALKTARARYGTGGFLNLHCRIGITKLIPTSSETLILKIPWASV